jgi:phosphoserine phosphatase
MPNIALFDLDHTLIPIDSDYEWGQFLCRVGAVDAEAFAKRNADFLRNIRQALWIRWSIWNLHSARWHNFHARKSTSCINSSCRKSYSRLVTGRV